MSTTRCRVVAIRGCVGWSEFVGLTAEWSCLVDRSRWSSIRCRESVIVVAFCNGDGRVDRCHHFLFIVVVRPTDSPASSHWYAARSLHDHWMCNVHRLKSGNENPNVFGSWPPYMGLFYESGQIKEIMISLLILSKNPVDP